MSDTNVASKTQAAAGVLLTVAIIAATLMVLRGFPKEFWGRPLDLWSQVCAASVSALAFLWLVLGYFQQSRELRANTAALRLQQVALQDQVAATQTIANAAKRQAEISEKILLHPRFVFVEFAEVDRPTTVSMNFIYHGAPIRIDESKLLGAADVQIQVDPKELAANHEGRITALQMPDGPVLREGSRIIVRFSDQDGVKGAVQLRYTGSSEGFDQIT